MFVECGDQSPADSTAHSRPPAVGGGGGHSLPQVCVLLRPRIERTLIHPQLAAGVANGTPGVMCPASEWHTCADSLTQRRIRQNLGYSWVFDLAITAAVRFQIGTFLVSPMAVTFFASVASNLRQGSANIVPPVTCNLTNRVIGPLERWVVLSLGYGKL